MCQVTLRWHQADLSSAFRKLFPPEFTVCPKFSCSENLVSTAPFTGFEEYLERGGMDGDEAHYPLQSWIYLEEQNQWPRRISRATHLPSTLCLSLSDQGCLLRAFPASNRSGTDLAFSFPMDESDVAELDIHFAARLWQDT
jgi:hypothetical protein